MAADALGGGSDVVAGVMPPSGQPRFSRQSTPRTRGRVCGLAASLVGRAVAAEFAGRQIAETDPVARGHLARDRAAQANFEIVGMWAEDEEVERHVPLSTLPSSVDGRRCPGWDVAVECFDRVLRSRNDIPLKGRGSAQPAAPAWRRRRIHIMVRSAVTRPGPTRQRITMVGAALALGGALLLASVQVPGGATMPTSDLIDARQLVDDLRVLSSDEMAGRQARSAGGANARRLIAARFRAAGLEPVGEGYEHAFGGTARSGGAAPAPGGVNVIGRVVGTGPPGRYLVVSAHYDHVGVRNGQIFNGANDNASGAAALSVIAAYFTRHRPVTSIVFVAFDAEEEGLAGSRAFVGAPPVPATSLIANLNMDMIGRDEFDTLWASGARRFPVLEPFLKRVAASAPIAFRMGHDDPSAPGGDDWTRSSDQWAFIEAGIPALYIGVEDYRYLHKPDDDFETMMLDFYVARRRDGGQPDRRNRPRHRCGGPREGLGEVSRESSVPALSEVGPLEDVLVSRVQDAFTDQACVAREWQGLNYTAEPDLTRAAAEYAAFVEILRAAGAAVRELGRSPDVGLDSLYARDASIVTPRGLVLCRMGKPQRSGEPAAHGRAFDAWGLPVIGAIRAPGQLEGGDLLWLDGHTVVVGRGYRTNDEGISQLRALLPADVECVVVGLPHWRGPADVFHLMSIISPVDRNLAVVYAPLMPVPFRERLLDAGFDLVEVPDAEFDSMGANVLALGPRRALMLDGNPITRRRLEAAGADVVVYRGVEISLKGGGGPTCLTRPLRRRWIENAD